MMPVELATGTARTERVTGWWGEMVFTYSKYETVHRCNICEQELPSFNACIGHFKRDHAVRERWLAVADYADGWRESRIEMFKWVQEEFTFEEQVALLTDEVAQVPVSEQVENPECPPGLNVQ